MNLNEHYKNAKERLVNNCIKCGNCIKHCRVMEHADAGSNYHDIQEAIIDYLSGGAKLSGASERKVNACMRCFGCLEVPCPINVPSMLTNQLVNVETEKRKEKPWDMILYPVHEKLARRLTTEDEYKRITTEKKDKDADVLFFPGCNVYKQADKLMNALVIMDEIKKPYSFAPGMKYCCGWSVRGSGGDADWLQGAAEKLMRFAEELAVKKMVFWCPTCMCVLNDRIKKFYEPDFECMTFGQYVFENIEKLSFTNAKPRKVTYHEPCKTAYMGIDAAEENSVRKILKLIPGTELIEMKHHGKDTMCCGCDAIDKQFETGDKVTVARMKEAMDTGAGAMIDVCHNCHWIFKPAQRNHAKEGYDIKIVNYSAYITEAMGKPRDDSMDIAEAGV